MIGDADDAANETENATWNGGDAESDFDSCVHVSYAVKHWGKKTNNSISINLPLCSQLLSLLGLRTTPISRINIEIGHTM